MECLQNRIDSFTKPKRVKNPAKTSSFISVKWPHSPHSQFIATPETLAEAGFYYNPSFEDRDNVACFVCDKQLADWEAEDDPFDIHWAKCGDKCCWAIVRCGLRGDINRHGGFTFTDKSRVPTSKPMERARLETFSVSDGWIHDQVKNHGANSRKMARAGFVFTPQHAGDDLATCLYCNVALSGWEASDDPMEEHRKRQKSSCPMFDEEPATKPPSRAASSKPSAKSQPSKHVRPASPKYTDLVQPMKTHDGDASESDAAPPPSNKRIRTLPGSSRGAKTPKVSRSQSRSELKDVAEDDENVENEEDVPRTGRAKAKKSMGTTTKKVKSRSKSVVPRATSDDEEEEVVIKAPSRSRSKAKGKEKAVVDDDEPEEETKPLKKSTRGRPPTRVKEQEDEQEVKVPKKPTRGRAPPRVEEPEDEEAEEEQEFKILKKSTRGRVPPRIEEPENDDEDVTKTVKKPTRTKLPSRIEETATVPRKPSKSRKVKDPEPEPELETHDPDMEIVEEDDSKPRPPSKSRTKTPASRKPSRARPKAAPVPAEEEQEEEEEAAPATPPVVKKRAPSTSSKASAINTAPIVKPSSTLAKPTTGASGRTTPASRRDEKDGDADELEEPPETKKRVPSSSASTKLKALQSKGKGKAPVPAPPTPEEEAAGDEDDDEMDVFVSPRESPGPFTEEEIPHPKEKDPETDGEMEPLVVPKRGAKPSSSRPSTKPTKAVDEDVDTEHASVSRKSVKPQVAGKEVKPTRESEMKGRKPSFLKVVEISTDEEGGASDEERPTRKNGREPAQKTMSPVATEGSSSMEKSKKSIEKSPVVVEPPSPQPPAKPAPSRKSTPSPPSPPPAPAQQSQDVEMADPESEPEPLVETQPAEPMIEVPVPAPQTPPRAAAPSKAPTPEPLFVPPLSKLPFAPLQNLTDAELDMTVEEWIRYQMEMEYDKFKRDGEREIGRFKKRAEEAKGIIERL